MAKKLEKLHLIDSSHLNIAVNDDDDNDNVDDEHNHENSNFSQSLSVLLRNCSSRKELWPSGYTDHLCS